MFLLLGLFLLLLCGLFFYKPLIKKLAFSKNCIKKLMGGNEIFYVLFFEVFLTYFVLFKCDMQFNILDKLFFAFLSFVIALNYKIILNYLKENINNFKFVLVLFLLVFYFTLALFGNRLFTYPLENPHIRVVAKNCVKFCLCMAWVFPIITFLLFLISKINLISKNSMSSIKFSIICVITLLVPVIFALIAFNPGISSPDTTFCLAQTTHGALVGMRNWHPPFYCMILKAIVSVYDSTYSVILVQSFFYCYVILEGMLFAKKKNINEILLIVLVALISINPSNYLHAITIWKDVPYCYSLVWLTILLAKFIFDKDCCKKIYVYVELFVALVFTFFMRQNGMVVYFLTVATLFFFIKQNKRILISVLTSILIVFLIRVPLYNHLQIKEGMGGVYTGLGHDIVGTYYAGGEISDKTKEIVEIMTASETNYVHNPYWANYSLGAYGGPIKQFITGYIDTFVKNPEIMIKAILCRNDIIWNIYTGKNGFIGCENFTGTQDTNPSWNEHYPARKDFKIRNLMVMIGDKFVEYFEPLTWRSGIYTFAVIFILWFLVLCKKLSKIWFIFVPFFAQILSLLLSTGWCDFRYYWSLNLMSVFIVIFSIYICNEKVKNENTDI